VVKTVYEQDHQGFLKFSIFIGRCLISSKLVKWLLIYHDFLLKMAATTISLLADVVWRAELHFRAKFRQNSSIRGGYIVTMILGQLKLWIVLHLED